MSEPSLPTMIKRWWHARQRAVDIEVLWPQCVEMNPTPALARAAFRHHVAYEPAWCSLLPEERRAIINALPDKPSPEPNPRWI